MIRIPSKHRWAALALAAGATSLPAHAQWGLFQSMMQGQNQAQEAQARQEQAAAPAKKWASPQPVPEELRQRALAFAGRVPHPELRGLYERLYIEGERNATLNYERIGLAALAAGKLDLAEHAFEAATFRIDQIYADNAEAQKAKSLWSAEKVKDYKGEPYERAMAYFYRGLVYAARGDFQNARAMFKQADYQDTVTEAEEYAGDFGLMPYMAGWASYCDGNANLARDYLQMAARGDANYTGTSVEQPVLVLFETGRAPFKYGAGKHSELLKWQPHPLPKQTLKSVCTVDGDCLPGNIVQAADLGYQATTRGGRPIDAVLDGKASFKDGAQGVATAATTVGAVGMDLAMATGNRDMAGIGLLGMFAGLVAQGIAASTQAQADIREWEQLPDTIWLATAQARREGALTAQLETDGNGATTPQAFARLVDTPSCQLYWGRSIDPLGSMADAGPLEPGEHARDPALRQELDAQPFAAAAPALPAATASNGEDKPSNPALAPQSPTHPAPVTNGPAATNKS